MADIKLVIKVPEELYRAYKDRPPRLGDAGMDMIAQAIANGTPLDDVNAEMQRRADDPWNMAVGSASKGLENAIEILDNISETESEE